jgi:hypothetical protein
MQSKEERFLRGAIPLLYVANTFCIQIWHKKLSLLFYMKM